MSARLLLLCSAGLWMCGCTSYGNVQMTWYLLRGEQQCADVSDTGDSPTCIGRRVLERATRKAQCCTDNMDLYLGLLNTGRVPISIKMLLLNHDIGASQTAQEKYGEKLPFNPALELSPGEIRFVHLENLVSNHAGESASPTYWGCHLPVSVTLIERGDRPVDVKVLQPMPTSIADIWHSCSTPAPRQ